MKVRAVRLGYYNHKRYRPGAVFVLKDEKLFSSKWMEKVEDESPKRGKGKGKPEPEVEADELEGADDSEVI